MSTKTATATPAWCWKKGGVSCNPSIRFHSWQMASSFYANWSGNGSFVQNYASFKPTTISVKGVRLQSCHGACQQQEAPETYNERVEAAVGSLLKSLPSFTLLDAGRHPDEKSCILIEQGRLYGMGYLPTDVAIFRYPGIEGIPDPLS
jgi:hypothetical protein